MYLFKPFQNYICMNSNFNNISYLINSQIQKTGHNYFTFKPKMKLQTKTKFVGAVYFDGQFYISMMISKNKYSVNINRLISFIIKWLASFLLMSSGKSLLLKDCLYKRYTKRYTKLYIHLKKCQSHINMVKVFILISITISNMFQKRTANK